VFLHFLVASWMTFQPIRVGRFLYAVLRLDACVTDFTKGRWARFCTGKSPPVAEGKKKVSE
jgi:hypothetical protein